MLSFRRFIVLLPACRRLVKPKMISLKLESFATEPSPFSLDDFTLSRFNQMRCLATDSIDAHDIAINAPKRERAKTPEAPKITLLDANNNISVCTMEEAQKIAKSKKLRLVQLTDSNLRTQRLTYKLMSEDEYLEEELREKRRAKEEAKKVRFVKGDKLLTISTRCSEHDVDIKVNKALKWFEKRYEIRVIILGSAENTVPQEQIYRKFAETFKPIGRIVQKRVKNGDLKFQIIPPKREDPESLSDTDEVKNKSDTSVKEEVSDDKCEALKETS